MSWSEWSVARRTEERRSAGGERVDMFLNLQVALLWRVVSTDRAAQCVFHAWQRCAVRGAATCTSWSENAHQRSSEEHIASTFRVQKTMLNSFAAVNFSDITVASLTALSHLHVQDVADREWPCSLYDRLRCYMRGSRE